MQTTWMTLVFLIQNNEVLLDKKVKGIGAGKWNGWGGKVENETIRQAAVRELKAELELIAEESDLEKVAIMTFINTTEEGEETEVKMVVFLLRRWKGELRANPEEMLGPTWWRIDSLPNFYEHPEFMSADPFWFPLVLSGKKLVGKAIYTPNQEALIKPVEIIIQDRI